MALAAHAARDVRFSSGFQPGQSDSSGHNGNGRSKVGSKHSHCWAYVQGLCRVRDCPYLHPEAIHLCECPLLSLKATLLTPSPQLCHTRPVSLGQTAPEVPCARTSTLSRSYQGSPTFTASLRLRHTCNLPPQYSCLPYESFPLVRYSSTAPRTSHTGMGGLRLRIKFRLPAPVRRLHHPRQCPALTTPGVIRRTHRS